MFHIDHIPIEGEVFLAPMAGISDSPYRGLCRAMGAGFSFTEFISTDGITHGNKRSLDLFRFKAAERPIIFQIFGNKPDVIVEAAKIAESLEPDVLDLNMGCSVSKVAHKGSGAGMLRDPIRTGKIVELLRKNLNIPVTVKIRLGWDDKSLNYLEVARIMEDSGACMISVHGRTKHQGYKGEARWDPIGEIKQRAGIPILGNGDISTYRQALERKRMYGLDGVLVGRGAIGNPWIFAGRERADVSLEEVFSVALAHLNEMILFYADGLLLFRKHATRYFNGFPGAASLRNQMMRANSAAEFADICGAFLEKYRSGLIPGTESESRELTYAI